jgi:mono/diheme cytochrome c family protein
VKQYQLMIVVFSVFLASVAALAQTRLPDTSLTANPVFQKNCAKCHGKTAQGHRFRGPSLVSPKTTATSADKLHNIIANGEGHIPKFHMPGFESKLTSQEIDSLVQQIRAPTSK